MLLSSDPLDDVIRGSFVIFQEVSIISQMECWSLTVCVEAAYPSIFWCQGFGYFWVMSDIPTGDAVQGIY